MKSLRRWKPFNLIFVATILILSTSFLVDRCRGRSIGTSLKSILIFNDPFERNLENGELDHFDNGRLLKVIESARLISVSRATIDADTNELKSPSPSPSPSPSQSPSPSPLSSPSPSPLSSPSPSSLSSPSLSPLDKPMVTTKHTPVPSSPSPPSSQNKATDSPSSSTVVTLLPPPEVASSSDSNNHTVLTVLAFIGGGSAIIITSTLCIILFRKRNAVAVKPWMTGLSGQLQRAFTTGVPNLKRSELEAACEEFSNVLGSSPIGMVFKGTLSSGVEIAVVSLVVTSAKDWTKNMESQFRKKIGTLAKVNHKNFVNLLGYCEEESPFTRMMVFEYASNGTLFDHLHSREGKEDGGMTTAEQQQVEWKKRMRIAMGVAYCLEHMHSLRPPVFHTNLTSSSVNLSEDFSAKLSDFSFGGGASECLHTSPSISGSCNVHGFGRLLLEIVTGEEDDCGEVEMRRGSWRVDRKVEEGAEGRDVEAVGEVIRQCMNPDPEKRPEMKEVCVKMREITGVEAEAAIPRLSPLWWAELEILSVQAS